MRDVRAAVVEIINNVCRPEKPDLSDPDRNLVGVGLDSLDFASVLIALEDEFGVTVSEEDMEGLGTLNAIIAYVKKQGKA